MEEHHVPRDKKVTTDLSRFKVVKGNKGSNYSEQLDRFLDRINPSRVSAGYKPYSHSRFGKMLKDAGYKSDDLYALYQECNKARCFSSLLHYKLKNKS